MEKAWSKTDFKHFGKNKHWSGTDFFFFDSLQQLSSRIDMDRLKWHFRQHRKEITRKRGREEGRRREEGGRKGERREQAVWMIKKAGGGERGYKDSDCAYKNLEEPRNPKHRGKCSKSTRTRSHLLHSKVFGRPLRL